MVFYLLHSPQAKAISRLYFFRYSKGESPVYFLNLRIKVLLLTANLSANALKVACYFDETKNVLVVYDLFKDGAALGQHLGTTAAGHFPSLLQIAIPGPFLFCGNVPEELKQAALGMGLDATFAPRVFGFDRSLVSEQ